MPGKVEVTRDFVRQLTGYGLTTAEILYRYPDHPHLIQTFVWQDYDVAPAFPVLKKFLHFWHQTLEGPLVSVRVGHSHLLKPAEIKLTDREFWLH